MDLLKVPRQLLNVSKTIALFGALWATLLVLWFLLARQSTIVLWAVCALAVLISGVAYFKCADYPVRAMKARPVLELEQPALFQLVRELCTAARIPMPRLYVSPAPAPNAFATGRSPKAAIVCCTQGLLDTLSQRELRAVLAHELMHVKHRDTLPGSVVGILTGLIGGLSGLFVQVAVSRARELRADQDAALLTGDPLGLALALRKLESGAAVSPLPATSEFRAVAYLMTAQPFRAEPGRFFDTHPPIRLRIARLERAAFVRFTGNQKPKN